MSHIYPANLDCVTGVACLMYGTMGIFGAARFGQATEGDCLVNTWLGGRREGWIDLAMALYLSISIPPMQVSHSHQSPSVILHIPLQGTELVHKLRISLQGSKLVHKLVVLQVLLLDCHIRDTVCFVCAALNMIHLGR